MKKFTILAIGVLFFALVSTSSFGQSITINPTAGSPVIIKRDGFGLSHTSTNGLVQVGTYVDENVAFIQTHSNHPLHFSTNNGSTQMILLQNGNFGIGTTTPTARLDVNGDARIRGVILNEEMQTPTLVNSWVNYLSGYAPAAYYKDKEGRVHLSGLIKSGQPSLTLPAFTLPLGYRPSTSGTQIFSVTGSTEASRVDVLANGQVMVIIGTSSFVSLSGISFRAD